MKQLMCVLLLVLTVFKSSAQLQDIEQLQLDLEKLAQFKVMLAEMKNGYAVLQNGYNAIKGISKENFDLHKNWLDGLLQVSAAVKNNPLLKEIVSTQSSIMMAYKNAFNRFGSSGVFSVKELADMKLYYDGLIGQTEAQVEMLTRVITPGTLRMSDGERIKTITALNGHTDELLSALRKYNATQNEIVLQRQRAQRDTHALKGLYGIK